MRLGAEPGLLVKELFERDPTRHVEPVIKVDEQDPRLVGAELEEYVVTDEIRRDLADIIDRFIESRRGPPESVCGWISGFFGSGKSHFLKVLGYLLANAPVRLEDGREVGATSYFCERHSIQGSAMLEKELRTNCIFVNMLNFDREKGPSITRIVYTALLKETGLSEVLWIAEIERTLQAMGLWDKFQEYVKASSGQPWSETRKMQVMARPLLAQALHTLDLKTFPSVELAERSISDVEKGFELTPRTLAERLLDEATRLDGRAGRLLVLLDEVGLYVGTHTDRLTDLNILAEEIERIGRGKVWLFVTAQEALEEAIPRIEAFRGQFEKIKDRFRIKVSLTPENIDTVVKKRLLQKSAEPSKLEALEGLFKEHSGKLATAALIKSPVRDYHGLFTQLAVQDFLASYPLMPYHVRLMQEIFSLLRSRGRAAPELTGRERAVLGVVRALLVGPKEQGGLAYAPLGALATFDAVYDAIDVELKAVRAEQQAVVDQIAQLGEREGLRVDSVAKALFLLQQVSDWIPCTLENVAAVLYPTLGVEKNEFGSKVKACLEELKRGRWVAEEDGKFRFLLDVERTFEQDVAGKIATSTEKQSLTLEAMKTSLKDLRTFNYRGLRVFNVYLTGDDEDITSKGHLKLCFYSPLRAARDGQLVKSLLLKSLTNIDTVYWVCPRDERFEGLLERIICTEKALKDREAKPATDEEAKILAKRRTDIETQKNDELPVDLVNAAKNGTIIYQGQEMALDGKKDLQVVFNEQMKDLAEELFTEFSYAAFAVERDEHIGSILMWQGGRLPKIYGDLQLIDDKGNVLIDRPVASRILAEVRRRQPAGEECTGAALIEHFEAKPYGWETRIVRVTLAALFKNGSVIVNLDGKEYVSASESGSHDAFTNARAFNRARFSPGIEITPEQRNQAWQLLSSVFGERVGNTTEEIDAALVRCLTARVEQCDRLQAVAATMELPLADGLSSLGKAMKEIKDAPSRSRRILDFLVPARLDVIKTQLPVLTKFAEFESKGNLNQYKLASRFAGDLGPQVLSTERGPAVSEILVRLGQSLKASDFMDRWPTIIADCESVKETYLAAYRALHGKRSELVARAVDGLKDHPVVERIDASKFQEFLEPLAQLSCSTKDFKVDEGTGFVCSDCRASLKDLVYHMEVVVSRGEAVRRKLDQVLRAMMAGKDEEVITGFVERITKPADVPTVASRLGEVSEKALRKGRAVKVGVEVE